jgi:D-methionine transport system substrate-binding protein
VPSSSRAASDPIAGINATPRDIIENPRKFRLAEIEAAQLPRTLDDPDASAVNADYANKAGLNPARDGILVEDKDGPYACLIAVREQDKDQPWVEQLVKAYQDRRGERIHRQDRCRRRGAGVLTWHKRSRSCSTRST